MYINFLQELQKYLISGSLKMHLVSLRMMEFWLLVLSLATWKRKSLLYMSPFLLSLPQQKVAQIIKSWLSSVIGSEHWPFHQTIVQRLCCVTIYFDGHSENLWTWMPNLMFDQKSTSDTKCWPPYIFQYQKLTAWQKIPLSTYLPEAHATMWILSVTSIQIAFPQKLSNQYSANSAQKRVTCYDVIVVIALHRLRCT